MSYTEFPIIRLKVLNTSTFSSSSNDARNVNQSLLTFCFKLKMVYMIITLQCSKQVNIRIYSCNEIHDANLKDQIIQQYILSFYNTSSLSGEILWFRNRTQFVCVCQCRTNQIKKQLPDLTLVNVLTCFRRMPRYDAHNR